MYGLELVRLHRNLCLTVTLRSAPKDQILFEKNLLDQRYIGDVSCESHVSGRAGRVKGPEGVPGAWLP
jgi:hypothetical protein